MGDGAHGAGENGSVNRLEPQGVGGALGQMPQRSRQHAPIHAPVGQLGRAAAAQAVSAYAGGGRACLGKRFPWQRDKARVGRVPVAERSDSAVRG